MGNKIPDKNKKDPIVIKIPQEISKEYINNNNKLDENIQNLENKKNLNDLVEKNDEENKILPIKKKDIILPVIENEKKEEKEIKIIKETNNNVILPTILTVPKKEEKFSVNQLLTETDIRNKSPLPEKINKIIPKISLTPEMKRKITEINSISKDSLGYSEKKRFENRKKLIIDRIKIEEEKSLIRERERHNEMLEHIKLLNKINIIKKKNSELARIRDTEKNMKISERLINKFNRLILRKDIIFQNKKFIEKLEYIIELGKSLYEEIIFDSQAQIYNLISCEEARFYDTKNKNFIIKILGYFGSELSLYNINTYIEKTPTNEIIRRITFKIITSGLATQRVYKLIMVSYRKKKEFRKNIEEWFKFNESIKNRISKIYNMPEENIFFFNYDIENVTSYMLIKERKINGISVMITNYDVRVEVRPLLKNIILSSNFFEIKFCKSPSEWPNNNLIRGGYRYHPPYEYFGLGLKIKEKYQKYDDAWFGKKGYKEGEWPIAYHGVGKGNVFLKVLNIINDNLKEGPGQLLKDFISIKNKDQFYYCNEGVYLSPNIEEAQKYASKTFLGNIKRPFQFVIMTRVNPKRIRDPGIYPANWILSGNEKEIRPYRLLVKFN